MKRTFNIKKKMIKHSQTQARLSGAPIASGSSGVRGGGKTRPREERNTSLRSGVLKYVVVTLALPRSGLITQFPIPTPFSQLFIYNVLTLCSLLFPLLPFYFSFVLLIRLSFLLCSTLPLPQGSFPHFHLFLYLLLLLLLSLFTLLLLPPPPSVISFSPLLPPASTLSFSRPPFLLPQLFYFLICSPYSLLPLPPLISFLPLTPLPPYPLTPLLLSPLFLFLSPSFPPFLSPLLLPLPPFVRLQGRGAKGVLKREGALASS